MNVKFSDEQSDKLLVAFYGAFFAFFGFTSMYIAYFNRNETLFLLGILCFGSFGYYGIFLAVDRVARAQFFSSGTFGEFWGGVENEIQT